MLAGRPLGGLEGSQGGSVGGRLGASKGVGPGLEKAWLQWALFFERLYGKNLGGRNAEFCVLISLSRRSCREVEF